MTEEVWKPVTVNGEPWPYEVSNMGRVRRSELHPRGGPTYVGKIVCPRHRAEYLLVNLHKDGTRKVVSVHRLVLEAFKGPCPSGHEANHMNGIKDDNMLENLEWVTHKENIHHAWDNGFVIGAKGSRNPNSKLSERDIPEIRRRLVKGENQRGIARDYGVSQITISLIARWVTWKHVGGIVSKDPLIARCV